MAKDWTELEWLNEIRQSDGMECLKSWFDEHIENLVAKGHVTRSGGRGPAGQWYRLEISEEYEKKTADQLLKSCRDDREHLLSVKQILDERVKVLEGSLRIYGRHFDSCDVRLNTSVPCSCGFVVALSKP